MNSRQLIQLAKEGQIQTSALTAICASLEISLPNLCDVLSKEIAEDYLSGNITWDDGDIAMNSLFAWAYGEDNIGLSEFSMAIFSAFDQAEFKHDQPVDSGPEFHTLPRLRNILAIR